MLSTPLQAVEGFWVNSSGGNWNDAFNWTNSAAPPNGAGHIANLTAPLTGNRAIALASEVTLGKLVVENDEYDRAFIGLDGLRLLREQIDAALTGW